MPGILPMKVIKVGTSSQGRIAQACDRCRSKKIRCDGIRPTCTQCSSVGFECRTSDKLSRRAFPRGYTESLEERVRQLEGEVRELKDLLDEKDEKIDMLSKLHGNRRCHSTSSASAGAPSSAQSSPDASTAEKKKDGQPREETFKVQASPLLLGVENSDSYFMGPSSGRSFIESFKRKMLEMGKPAKDFNVEAFLHIQGCLPLMTQDTEPLPSRMPPRLFTDRCVNVFFQEWAPLFPVLHKPTFLRVYEEFVLDPEKVKSNHKLTQLYLVFSIAGLASESPDLPQLVQCERQWQDTLDAVIMENTMNTLQCLVLALLYCTMRADYKRLQHYKGIAVSLSHRLGLHQNQKRFSFGALTTETRKKVFWTLYTLDCFTAATLGLPKLLRESDVHAEYPSDTDDEYVSERGFQPTLPGEYTRLSNALALFRVTRILARVLETNYPATTTQDLSLQDMYNLDAELDAWHAELPSHLRLNFKQDKPSTDITGSRSPLLALAYYFIRVLIFRPAIGSTLGPKAAPALLSIGESSKHIIQVAQLLEERNMTFAFCVNKHDLLTVCGLTLLYQAIDLAKTSKVRRDDERLVTSVVESVVKAKAPGSIDFERVATLLIDVDCHPDGSSNRSRKPKKNDCSSVSPASNPGGCKLSYGSNSKSSSNEDLRLQQEKLRRVTMPNPKAARPDPFKSWSRQSFDSLPENGSAERHQAGYGQTHACRPRPNLDYLSLSNTPSQSQPQTPGSYARGSHTSGFTNRSGAQNKLDSVSPSEWEALLGSMDSGMNNVYNAIYGGQGFMADSHITATDPATGAGTSGKPTASNGDCSSDLWDLTGFNINDFGDSVQGGPQSVLSLSDESLSSGEEVAPSELGLSVGSVDFHGGIAPSSRQRQQQQQQQQQQTLNGIFQDLEGYSL